MRLYVIRHGESENNLKKCWTGWYDAPLTEKGRQDARKAGTFLQGITFDKIYTSDLSRAAETACIAVPGCGYETSPLLREINVGALENTLIAALPEEKLAQLSEQGYGEFGGETKEELNERAHRFLRQLEGESFETVAAFAHGGFLRSTLDAVLGVAIQRGKVCCDNCAIAVYEYTDGRWRLHSWINLT